MQYVSTRGQKDLGSFGDTLLLGLAADGGLAMPAQIPRFGIEQLERWRGLSYAELAYEVMRPFIDDIPADDLRALLQKTYHAEAFGNEEITPISKLGDGGLYLLELSHGPSLAFKDLAMQFLGHAFEYFLEKKDKYINILGATSGDTGSAAEYAMLGKERVRVFMLSPHGRMSQFQQAQMFSLNEANIFNISLRGVFDDCQDLVKELNSDAEFKQKYQIGAVNSINWARVLAQAVYYFKGYFALNLPAGAEVDFCVPSGNFGNIFSGYLAKRMGLPIGRLIVASNENNVLYEFFEGGSYSPWEAKRVAATSSPSMDIGKASNLERYLYLISGSDGQKIAQWWDTLATEGSLNLSSTPYWQAIKNSGFGAGFSSHKSRLDTIRWAAALGRVIDPHTADGVFVARQHQRAGVPMVCLETAAPAKFEETVQEALGRKPERPAKFNGIEEKPRYFTEMENDAQELKRWIAEALAAAERAD